MDIAFIGMGLMGAPMALNCLKAGHRVRVYNRTAAKCEPLRAAGAEVAATPADAAAGREAALICVENTGDVESVLFGEQGLIHGLTRGEAGAGSSARLAPLVIDHSTISPLAEARFAERMARDGDQQHPPLYLDAPVSGGDVGAQAGTLAIMCGGPNAAFERAEPLLKAMGKTIVHIGERPGDGQRAKLVNQVIVSVNCIATTEAMRFGEAMGLDMERVLSAISQGAASSWSLSSLGPRYLRRDFKAGFRLKHLMKDLQFCRELMAGAPHEAGSENFPGAALALDLVRRAVDSGHGAENIHAMARPFVKE